MKILIHCNYDPENFGGIEMVTRNLLDILIKRNIEIEVIASSNVELVEQRSGYTFRGLRILHKISGTPILLWGNTRFLWAGMRANLIIYQEPFPTLLPALFILRFIMRKKILVLVHAIPCMPSLIAYFYNKIRTLILSTVPVVTTSPILLDQLNLRGTVQRNVIPLCFDETNLETNDSICELPKLPERYMLFFGRLARYKGLDILMPAILDTPEVQFVIAGVGVMDDYINNFIELNRLKNVLFINKSLSDYEKLYIIKNCYCLILPSINNSEAFAIVQLEAMYYSRPIINTQLNNGVNYVAPPDVAALTVPVGDVHALTNSIKNIWGNNLLAHNLGIGGKTRFGNLFSKNSFNHAWSKYFDSFNI